MQRIAHPTNVATATIALRVAAKKGSDSIFSVIANFAMPLRRKIESDPIFAALPGEFTSGKA